MRFIFVSEQGDSLFLANHIQKAGHDVVMWIINSDAKKIGDGIVPKTDKLDSVLKDKDDTVVVFDMVGQGALADRLRKKGFPVVGGGVINDRLELDRNFGVEVMRAAGIATPKGKSFTSFEAARSYVKANEKAMVFKPSGNLPTQFTHVADSQEEMLEMLSFFEKTLPRNPHLEFLIQNKINGVELSHEAWFNGDEFIFPVNSTIERKRFLNDDLGPNIGCAHSLVWLWDDERPKIFRMTLERMKPVLRRHNYIGPLDINTIVNEEDRRPYGLEWTARFGYSALQALLQLFDGDFGGFLNDLATGTASEFPSSSGFFGSALRVSVPPYPHDSPDDFAGLPILNFDDTKHALSDVFRTGDGDYRVAGYDGVISEAIGVARSVKNSIKQSLNNAFGLQVPNAQFRTDIGNFEDRHLKLLSDWKYF